MLHIYLIIKPKKIQNRNIMPKNNDNLNLLFNMLLFKFN